MDISLYYVRGIDKINTPYHSSVNEQQAYFNAHKVGTIINTYYPPHYRDTISLDTNDININENFNYLSINYLGKEYYYFIDRVNYVSEEVFEVDIVIDSIQTYMFDIVWNNALVSRRLIDRWKNNRINRDYYRENISNGNFKLDTYKDYTTDFPFIVIETTGNIDIESSVPEPTIFKSYKLGKTYTTGTIMYIIPWVDLGSNISHIIMNSTYAPWTYPEEEENPTYESAKFLMVDLLYALRYLLENPKVVNVYAVTTHELEGVSVSVNDNTLEVTLDDTWNAFIPKLYDLGIPSGQTEHAYIYGFCCVKANIDENEYLEYININNHPFKINDKINEDFDISYVPQLLDENFMQVQWGERTQTTGFPLFELETPVLTCNSWYDLASGNRYYTLTKGASLTDRHLTMAVGNSQELMPTYSDAWKDYISRNYGSATIGLATNVIGSIFNYNTSVGNYNHSTTSDGNTTETTSTSVSGNLAFSPVKGLLTSAGELAKITNIKFTPDVQKQGNNFSGSYIASSLQRIFIINAVDDIYDVAYTLESVGYLVHENYYNENIINTLNTRYYYNYIQLESLDFNLNRISDNETLDDIEARFKTGVRFYNKTPNGLDTLEVMGIVCRYDNVEKSLL